jgi:hypothetical protein
MRKTSYSGYRFPLEIIQQAIWLYVRFTLSLRDVEDLLAERRSGGVLRDGSALGQRHLVSAQTHRALRADAMITWADRSRSGLTIPEAPTLRAHFARFDNVTTPR